MSDITVDVSTTERIAKWLFFGVLIAVLPVMFSGVAAVTRNQSITWQDPIASGELLLVSVGISAAGLSDIFGRQIPVKYRGWQMLFVGPSVLVTVMASLWYADIAAIVRSGQPHNEQFVSIGSAILFAFSIVVAFGCTVMPTVARSTRGV